MYDLIYLAFLSDSTRVATFQLGRENGGGPHDLLSKAVGLGGAHGLTHSVKKTNGWQNLGTYNRYQMAEFGRFVKKLKDTPEPTGKATCSTTPSPCTARPPAVFTSRGIIPSSPPAAKPRLQQRPLPPVRQPAGGRQSARCRGHQRSGWRGTAKEEDQPLGHLFVSILQRLGVETDTFAGCTGTLNRV